MDFELSGDQEALVGAVNDFCVGRLPMDTVRSLADCGGVDRPLWRELAEMGVFGLPVAEADGGVGLGWADAVLVAETLARYAVPGPLVSAMALGALIDGVVDGTTVPVIVERPSSGPIMVEYFTAVDLLVILDDEGVSVVDAAACDGTPLPFPLDPLTPVAQLHTLPVGERIGDASVAAELRTRGAILTAATQLGLAAGATDLAVAYALDRQQFGKPIGQFQAVKHMCADMATKVELARAAVYCAGVTLDDTSVGDPVEAASIAAIVASEAGDFCGKSCIQVHGGMGYTWEVNAHLFLKRSWVLDHTFGSADDHAELLAGRM